MFSFFRKKSTAPQVDFSAVATDMHSHLIPGIDDGAKTIEDSIALIKELHALGYKKFITTPHIMSDFYRNTPETILGGLEQVREAIKAENIPVTIDAAAEYYLDDGFIHKLEEEKLLTIGENNHLLFEISYVNAPDNLMEVISECRYWVINPSWHILSDILSGEIILTSTEVFAIRECCFSST